MLKRSIQSRTRKREQRAIKYGETRRVYTAAVASLILGTGFAMSSTVDWPDEMSSEFQAERNSTDAMTTSSESTMTPVSFVPFQSVLASFGYLGTFTNGLVLFGFWLSDRSKLTSTSVHIINHTALELTTTNFVIYILIPSVIMSVVSAFLDLFFAYIPLT